MIRRDRDRGSANRWVYATVALGALTTGCLGLIYRLLVARGRLLIRLDALEARALDGDLSPVASAESALRTQSLSPGTAAPSFGLLDRAGVDRRLTDWRGTSIVLAFLDHECAACLRLVPMLSDALAAEPAAEASLVVVCLGTVEGAAAMTAEIGERCTVLVDPDRRLGVEYAVPVTPSAYHVDPRGVIDEPIALGGEEILRMLTLPDRVFSGADSAGGVEARPLPLRPVTQSRINRAGLEPGAPAPEFDLPSIGGGRLSLEGFRGRRLLLVFSDPECKPCEELAPHLERLHRADGDIAVAVISRGEVELNARKQSDLRLTYPVGLQHHWRTSRDYAIFATPAGYLIDEQGEIDSPVAVGSDRILALAANAHTRPIEGSVK